MIIETSFQTARDAVARHLHDRATIKRSSHRFEIDTAGRCETPFLVQLTGRGDPVLQSQAGKTLFTDMWVRCRRCRWCRQRRSQDWAERARHELLRAPRTWFLTLTLSPSSHYEMVCRAGSDTLAARHRQISMELTKYLKRLRKTAQTQFRYVIVMEPHKSGLPHYHVLLHERDGFPPLRHAQLVGQWKLGFVRAKLADPGAARYVTKYLAKDAQARVRASLRYGQVADVDAAREVVLGHNREGSIVDGTRPPWRIEGLSPSTPPDVSLDPSLVSSPSVWCRRSRAPDRLWEVTRGGLIMRAV